MQDLNNWFLGDQLEVTTLGGNLRFFFESALEWQRTQKTKEKLKKHYVQRAMSIPHTCDSGYNMCNCVCIRDISHIQILWNDFVVVSVALQDKRKPSFWQSLRFLRYLVSSILHTNIDT